METPNTAKSKLAFLKPFCVRGSSPDTVWLKLTHHKHGDNQSKQSDGAPEDLDDEDLDEQGGIGGVGEGRSGAYLTHTEAADQVGEAGGQARAEHEVAAGPVAGLDLGVLVGQGGGELLEGNNRGSNI